MVHGNNKRISSSQYFQHTEKLINASNDCLEEGDALTALEKNKKAHLIQSSLLHRKHSCSAEPMPCGMAKLLKPPLDVNPPEPIPSGKSSPYGSLARARSSKDVLQGSAQLAERISTKDIFSACKSLFKEAPQSKSRNRTDNCSSSSQSSPGISQSRSGATNPLGSTSRMDRRRHSLSLSALPGAEDIYKETFDHLASMRRLLARSLAKDLRASSEASRRGRSGSIVEDHKAIDAITTSVRVTLGSPPPPTSHKRQRRKNEHDVEDGNHPPDSDVSHKDTRKDLQQQSPAKHQHEKAEIRPTSTIEEKDLVSSPTKTDDEHLEELPNSNAQQPDQNSVNEGTLELEEISFVEEASNYWTSEPFDYNLLPEAEERLKDSLSSKNEPSKQAQDILLTDDPSLKEQMSVFNLEELDDLTEEQLRELLKQKTILIEMLKRQLASHGEEAVDVVVSLDLAKRKLNEALQQLMSGNESAQKEFDRWDRYIRNHPEHILQQKQELETWMETQREANQKSLKWLRTYVPEDVWSTTLESLLQRGLSPPVAKRVWDRKVLWLCRTRPEFISKMHVADLKSKYSYQGIDIQELRAVWFCLPSTFENDSKGEKAVWCEGFLQRLKDLVAKEEKGELSKVLVRNPVYGDSSETLGPFDPLALPKELETFQSEAFSRTEQFGTISKLPSSRSQRFTRPSLSAKSSMEDIEKNQEGENKGFPVSADGKSKDTSLKVEHNQKQHVLGKPKPQASHTDARTLINLSMSDEKENKSGTIADCNKCSEVAEKEPTKATSPNKSNIQGQKTSPKLSMMQNIMAELQSKLHPKSNQI